jgi:pimeloyl-ACP methyl ester carboxylesterase
MRWSLQFLLTGLFFTSQLPSYANPDVNIEIQPVLETTEAFIHAQGIGDSRQGAKIRLALKHYQRQGAQPVLLIHGLAQNNRFWDSPLTQYSFARFLHSQGFDVWIGNERNAGTSGFRSETPPGPRHWSIDDYAIHDIPALIKRVLEVTGKKPFLIGHSLAAWGFEGYLAGLYFDEEDHVRPNAALARKHRQNVRGVITIAGVYGAWWEKSVHNAIQDPVQSEADYYHSNYELQLLAGAKPLYWIAPYIEQTPLDWIGKILTLPLEQIPFVGGQLRSLYEKFQNSAIETPVFSMFYYPPNCDPDMVRLLAQDSFEDFGPRVLEQLGNAVNDGKTSAFYHLTKPQDNYVYGAVRTKLRNMPVLFIAGGRDRMASAVQIFNDGYAATQSRDKDFLLIADSGHLDIVSGRDAKLKVMQPVANWLHARE